MQALTAEGDEIELATYHYPAECDKHSDEYKGVLFWVHGFSNYNARVAHVGMHFSKLGYDVYCMD